VLGRELDFSFFPNLVVRFCWDVWFSLHLWFILGRVLFYVYLNLDGSFILLGYTFTSSTGTLHPFYTGFRLETLHTFLD